MHVVPQGESITEVAAWIDYLRQGAGISAATICPGPGLLAVIWMVGLEAIAMGVIMIGLGWRLKHIHQNPQLEAGQTRI